MLYKGMDVRISIFVHDSECKGSSGNDFSFLFKILIFYIEYSNNYKRHITQSQNHPIILHIYIYIYIYIKEERERDNNIYKL